jgi:hypothetical protein
MRAAQVSDTGVFKCTIAYSDMISLICAQEHDCSACGHKKPRDAFSSRQMKVKNREARQCRECIAKKTST